MRQDLPFRGSAYFAVIDTLFGFNWAVVDAGQTRVEKTESTSRFLRLKPNSVAASASGHFTVREEIGELVKIVELARLRPIFQGLTLAKRAQLQAIVECRYRQLSAPVCESLVALGLARVQGSNSSQRTMDVTLRVCCSAA